jgi:hypothetical protein
VTRATDNVVRPIFRPDQLCTVCGHDALSHAMRGNKCAPTGERRRVCASCGHHEARHDLTVTDHTTRPHTVTNGLCRGCPCQRFIPRDEAPK